MKVLWEVHCEGSAVDSWQQERKGRSIACHSQGRNGVGKEELDELQFCSKRLISNVMKLSA